MTKEKIIEIMKGYVEEMESYCYFGSNMGIPEDEIEEIADKIMEQSNANVQPDAAKQG